MYPFLAAFYHDPLVFVVFVTVAVLFVFTCLKLIFGGHNFYNGGGGSCGCR